MPLTEEIARQTEYLLDLLAKSHKIIEGQLLKLPQTVDSKLTLGQMRILHYLMEHGSCSMHALAAHSRVVMSTMTDMANRLVRLGLVQRRQDSKDRRLVLLELTPRGRTQFEAKAKHVRERIVKTLAALSQVKRRELIQAIRTIEEILVKTYGK
ncbi:MarR family transcriptional regulator [candidate division FCPU426 bacterium]|nr:MarR family transcriptional regulator [candidate division FCPU426 bacterium]